MDGKTILNLSAATRSRIAPGDEFDLYVPEREPKTVELQRKLSHYLQPILSHQFLNNLA